MCASWQTKRSDGRAIRSNSIRGVTVARGWQRQVVRIAMQQRIWRCSKRIRRGMDARYEGRFPCESNSAQFPARNATRNQRACFGPGQRSPGGMLLLHG